MGLYVKRKDSNSNSGGGIGFISALQIAFIVLKLCKVINWSWLWVLSPLWISTILGIIFIIIIGILLIISD